MRAAFPGLPATILSGPCSDLNSTSASLNASRAMRGTRSDFCNISRPGLGAFCTTGAFGNCADPGAGAAFVREHLIDRSMRFFLAEAFAVALMTGSVGAQFTAKHNSAGWEFVVRSLDSGSTRSTGTPGVYPMLPDER